MRADIKQLPQKKKRNETISKGRQQKKFFLYTAMDPELKNKTATPSNTDESVQFSHITAVATGWMYDFLFVSLCQHFKEGQLDRFNETLSTVEGKFFLSLDT